MNLQRSWFEMNPIVYSEKDTVEKAIHRAEKIYNLDVAPLLAKLETLGHEAKAEQSLIYALNRISMAEPDWTFVAAELYLEELYEKAAKNRNYPPQDKYGDFYKLVKNLSEVGIYSSDLLESYSEEEIKELGKEMDAERDLLFNYIGLRSEERRAGKARRCCLMA